MTCIAGLIADGKVFIGADSAGVSGWDLRVRADRKLFANGPFLFGFTTSFRMGQILQHAFKPPRRDPKTDVMKFMVTDFIDGVRSALKEGGFATKNNEAESGGDFLVGYVGRLFRVCSDYQIAECSQAYDAVGCGAAYAIGSLHATKHMKPDERIALALAAAEAHSAGVRGPFHIESL